MTVYNKYNRIFVIYVLKDPRDLAWRYLGKSCSGDYRLSGHLNENNLKKKSHKNNWIKELQTIGLEPIFEIIEHWSSDKENKLAETEWIAECRRIGVDLTNESGGGEGACGAVRSKETREKMSKAKMGRPRTWYSAAMLGKHHTEESRAKISKSRAGKTPSLGMRHTADTKLQMSINRTGSGNGMFGKKHSEETRKLISQSQSGENHRNYGKPLNDTNRINISKARGGRPFIDNNGLVFWTFSEGAINSGISETSIFRILKGKVASVKGREFRYLTDDEIRERGL